MSNRQVALSHATRRTSLATCLAGALGLALMTASASEVDVANSAFPGQEVIYFARPEQVRGKVTKSKTVPPTAPTSIPGIRSVTTCADDGLPGSLRYEVGAAASGDTIDLSQLMCSTITLGSEINVNQDTLYLKGPGAANLAIDGDYHSRIFNHGHISAAKLAIYDLTITRGKYVASTNTEGACISSRGEVDINRSVVSQCILTSDSSMAHGAAIYAHGGIVLSSSLITGNHATHTGNNLTEGGGIFSYGGFHAYYSTVSSNTAVSSLYSRGGGVSVRGDVVIRGSTFYGNAADESGAIDMRTLSSNTAIIVNSTISRNTARYSYGGVFTYLPLTLANSTIAFNQALGNGRGAGLAIRESDANLQSSIIADNIGDGNPSDVDGIYGGTISAVSMKNLVAAPSNVPLPADTIHACPYLQPLADNGGPTLTHALRHMSPALDKGNNSQGLVTDQRFAMREANGVSDIGAVERQFGEEDELLLASGFDGLCDQ